MRGAKAFIALTVVMGGLLISSCKKHVIEEPQSSDPVFRADGTIDSDQFELVAGDDNAYMFTSIENENGVPVYSGKLSDGSLEIEMGIYDGLIDIPDHSVVSSLPSELVYSRKSTSPVAILSKDAFPNVDVIDHVIWTVDYGAPQTNTVTIMEPGNYHVCAEIVFIDNSSSVLCSELILGYARHANFQIKHFLNQNGTFRAWLADPQVAVEKIEWYLDNVLVSEDTEFELQLSPVNHILRADVNFENGVKRSKNMIIDGSLNGKFIDDLSFFENGISLPINRDFNIRLKLTKDGVTYSSDEINNTINTVSFDEITYYSKDADGNDVYKVKAHIVATVHDVQNVNGTRELEFDTTFGLAIPKD